MQQIYQDIIPSLLSLLFRNAMSSAHLLLGASWVRFKRKSSTLSFTVIGLTCPVKTKGKNRFYIYFMHSGDTDYVISKWIIQQLAKLKESSRWRSSQRHRVDKSERYFWLASLIIMSRYFSNIVEELNWKFYTQSIPPCWLTFLRELLCGLQFQKLDNF